MARPKKDVDTDTSVEVAAVVSTDPLAGVARSDMPALLAKAKAEGDKPLIAAILEACRK